MKIETVSVFLHRRWKSIEILAGYGRNLDVF